jgi:hypothetical protein
MTPQLNARGMLTVILYFVRGMRNRKNSYWPKFHHDVDVLPVA